MEIIIIILWSIMSLLTMTQYAKYCSEISFNDKIITGIIFIIGGPIFVINNVLCYFLDCILPEGWDNDD